MPSLTIKGIPDELYLRLKNQALMHRRSLNSEIIVCLEQATSEPAIDPESWLADVDRLRSSMDLTPLTDAGIRKAKDRGRR